MWHTFLCQCSWKHAQTSLEKRYLEVEGWKGWDMSPGQCHLISQLSSCEISDIFSMESKGNLPWKGHRWSEIHIAILRTRFQQICAYTTNVFSCLVSLSPGQLGSKWVKLVHAMSNEWVHIYLIRCLNPYHFPSSSHCLDAKHHSRNQVHGTVVHCE